MDEVKRLNLSEIPTRVLLDVRFKWECVLCDIWPYPEWFACEMCYYINEKMLENEDVKSCTKLCPFASMYPTEMDLPYCASDPKKSALNRDNYDDEEEYKSIIMNFIEDIDRELSRRGVTTDEIEHHEHESLKDLLYDYLHDY